MNGTSHFIIGCGVAVSMAYIGMKYDDINLCVAALSAPIGAMLPDIDHNNTKIGRARKTFVDTVTKTTIYGGLAAMLVTIIVNAVSSGVTDLKEILFNIMLPTLVTYLPVIICILLATSDGLKRRIKFFTKHRGIMHTVFPIIGLYVGAINFKNDFIAALVLGLAFGYTSHLLADCETVRGCPLLWPLYTEEVRIMKVTTGTFAEKLVLLLDLGGLACLAYML